MQTLAVFDFDKTLYTKNTLIEFTIFTLGFPQFAVKLIRFLPFYLLFKIKLIDDNVCKRVFLTTFYKHKSIGTILSKADQYSKEKIKNSLDPFHLERIYHHLNQGHVIVILSATFRFILQSWCKTNGIDLIATDVQVMNECLTGRLEGKNCYGKAKVAALKEKYNIEDYYIFGYGDSKSDLPFLALADEAYFKRRIISPGLTK